jgi:hypothetical protein
MEKYNIEGGFNFYDELYKSLDDVEIETVDACLISNLPLTDNHVKMECGHKFNYMPLFMDIKNHKQKFNVMEGIGGKLGQHQIRCPYCRNKQNGLLPYYEEFGLPKTHGVNYIDVNYKPPSLYNSLKQVTYKCEFLIPNNNYSVVNDIETYDVSGADVYADDENANCEANCKFFTCPMYGTKLNAYGDEKAYCIGHKKLVIKVYKDDISNKAKEERLKKREELKKLREEQKQNEKIMKQNEKKNMPPTEKKLKQAEKKKTKPSKDDEDLLHTNIVLTPHVIIDPSINITEGMCLEVLRTGQKKGQLCGCKVEKNNLCKRHYNLKHHKINNEIK